MLKVDGERGRKAGGKRDTLCLSVESPFVRFTLILSVVAVALLSCVVCSFLCCAPSSLLSSAQFLLLSSSLSSPHKAPYICAFHLI